MNDTIAAIATPPGRGGVGIVRVSGKQARAICLGLINKLPPARVAKYTPFLNADGSQIDEGLSLFFAEPNSFTGEDVLELHAHGGPIVLDLLMRRVLELGARLARAGEFSQRAFLNNKMDLVQVEAVAELINASSEQAAMAATRSLQGDFSKKITQLVADVTHLRMYVEAAIDFPEEEINFLEDAHVHNSLQQLTAGVDAIYAQAARGALLSEGVNAVIIGEPNVGKSTLINALTGQETAIVTPIAGTTRDTIKAVVNLDGVSLNIIDTAGLRETTDVVEIEGIKRTKQAIGLADVVLLVADSNSALACDPQALYPELAQLLKGNAQVIVIANKIDIAARAPTIEHFANYSVVAISAQAELGLDLLRDHIKEKVGVTHNPEGGLFLARRRHLDALERAQAHIKKGQQQLVDSCAGELLAEDLKHAQLSLSEITGVFTSDDLLGKIFAEFCIGK